MNIVNTIVTNRFLAPVACFVGGYALSAASLGINQIAAKSLGLSSIDILDHKDYNKYTKEVTKSVRDKAKLNKMHFDSAVGVDLSISTVSAIRGEISYRFLLETIVLPRIYSQFAVFSATRTCVSSLLFSANILRCHESNEVLAGIFLNNALLGVVSSLAKQKIGLVGSVFLSVGYSLYSWRYIYNQDLENMVKKIKAIPLREVIHPTQINEQFKEFIKDTSYPFILAYQGINLAYQGIKKIKNSFA